MEIPKHVFRKLWLSNTWQSSVPSGRKLRKSKIGTALLWTSYPHPCAQPLTRPKTTGHHPGSLLDPFRSMPGFALHKGAFRDAIALRYGWEPLGLPLHCACGESFNSCHALTCNKGGFTVTRHNEIGDLTANLLKEIFADVEIELKLQPLSGEEFLHASANRDPEARLDVKARGFWGGAFECEFFDVRVFNPRARSNAAVHSTAQMFRRHEMSKRRIYDQRVRDVEMSTFTPLVFSASGGFGPSALVTYKRIASRLSNKWSLPYSAIMGWLRCRVSFALLRSAVMCLRGPRQHVRGSLGSPVLAIAEGQF